MIRKVGFIGLGTMGKPMAINIGKAGFDLMVYDIREEPLRELSRLGGKIARSAKEVGEHGEIVEIAVLDDAQVEAVLFGEAGVLKGAKPGTVVAVHSTVLPKTLRGINKNASAKKNNLRDAAGNRG